MDREAQVEFLLNCWLRLRLAGQSPAVGELCQDCPDLQADLEQRIARFLDSSQTRAVPTGGPTSAGAPLDDLQPTLIGTLSPASLPDPGDPPGPVTSSRERLPLDRTGANSSPGNDFRTLMGEFPEVPLVTSTPEKTTPAGLADLHEISPRDREAPPVPGYEILEELGRGGMGVVYKARQVGLNRIVALKMILAGSHAGDTEVARFRIEAEAIARLHHPNIIQVYEIGQWQPTPAGPPLPFFSLEFCPGGSLEQKLRGTPLPPEQAATLVQILARAMHTAHEAGVIHRDLKPANVLLAADGTPRITDFGLARKIGTQGLTNPGAVMGTPSYMAPEQANCEHDVGPPADIFALGAILYECLTGRPPFKGTTALETVYQVLFVDPVPPSQLQPRVPRDLETITLACLRKEPGRRYASAGALANDLGHFLLGEPITARPVGTFERGLKWIRRHPVVAALSAALVFVTLIAFVSILWELRIATAALDSEKQARSARVRAEVDSLLYAVPQAVPSILERLRADTTEVGPYLDALWGKKPDNPFQPRHMRVALGLLAFKPDEVRRPLVDWMLRTDEPAEMLLIRDTLLAHWQANGQPDSDLVAELWQKAETARGSDRLRILAALAAFDPDNGRWKQAGGWAAEPLLRVNQLHLATWTTALRPVRQSLVPPLRNLYRVRGADSQREVAATVLSDFARDDPATLVDLLLDAEPRSYALFRPLLEGHCQQVIARLQEECAHERIPTWSDPPLAPGWQAVGSDLNNEIQKADGLVEERFAFCQSLPLGRLAAVTGGLGKSGYRPVRVRPWNRDGVVRVAVLWTRDGQEWRLEIGLRPERVRQRDDYLQREGFLPADVAGYLQPVQSERVEYAVLWKRALPGERARLFVHRLDSDLPDLEKSLTEAQLVPRTAHEIPNPQSSQNSIVCSGVWGNDPAAPADDLGQAVTARDLDRFALLNSHRDRLAIDVSLSPSRSLPRSGLTWLAGAPRQGLAGLPWAFLGAGSWLDSSPDHRYSGVWQSERSREAVFVTDRSPAEQVRQARLLLDKGYRPVSWCVAVVADRVQAVSLWQRPVLPGPETNRILARRANALVTLHSLTRSGDLWPLLRHSPDPGLRSQLLARLASLGVDVRDVLGQLEKEQDPSVKRALILALGDYGEEQLPREVREPWAQLLLGWYRNDPDPGIHGAIDWLLRHAREGPVPRPADWGHEADLQQIDRELAARASRRGPPAARTPGWWVDRRGQTFTTIPGPFEFWMGSPGQEPDRLESEMLHRRRVPRGFAVACKPVTLQQFQQFLKANPEMGLLRRLDEKLSPDPDCPMNAIDWYQAVAYCRWLSDLDDLPPEEMVYPPISEIQKAREKSEPLRLPANHLNRLGYRLATEAEWEYACRAGAVTARFHGPVEFETRVVSRYAWHEGNSGDRSWPVGQKRPNDLGLFDMLGNVWQWCHEPAVRYELGPWGRAACPDEERAEVGEVSRRLLRGGALDSKLSNVRCAARSFEWPATQFSTSGFRVARTLPDSGR
jgi:formylglycine-generating enzyme required for sulfatase activity